MEKLIQLVQAVHEEMGGLSWVALGVLLALSMVLATVALRWVRHGGLATGARFFARQRELARWLRSR